MTAERDIRFLEAAVAAALTGDRDELINAVSGMSEDGARELWTVLEVVQGCIEDSDGGSGERPWEMSA